MNATTTTTAPVATVNEYTVACECGLTIYPMLGQVAVTCSDCSARYAMPTRFEYGQVLEVTGTRP